MAYFLATNNFVQTINVHCGRAPQAACTWNHPRAGLLLTPFWARGSLHAGPLVGLRYPTGRCLLLCGLEDALLHDRLAHAVRKPAVRCGSTAFTQGQQELLIKVASTGLAQRGTLPLGGDVVEAQLLQLAGERRVLAPRPGHPRHRRQGSGLSQEHAVEGDLFETLHDVGRRDR